MIFKSYGQQTGTGSLLKDNPENESGNKTENKTENRPEERMVDVENPQIMDRLQKETCRYLGYHGVEPDEHVRGYVDQCIEELYEVMQPKYIWKRVPLRLLPDNELEISGVRVRSVSLTKNLKGCRQVCLMAATIGLGVDRLIARASVAQMSRAAIYQSAGAALVEQLCDEVNQKIIEEAAKEGLHCRSRFSPGYGDLPLEFQKDFFRLMNLTKEIGITLSKSLLMIPSKSVTALIGLSETEKKAGAAKCEECQIADRCDFRKEG